MRSFLYIDVDAFFASVEQAINRALIGKPVMVGGLKHERGVVACPSYEARALGVRTGTPLFEAAQKIPNGIFLRGDFNRYEHYSQEFYKILEQYSPDIQKISQDEACLDITGSIRHYQTAELLATRLQHEVQTNLALSTSIGIAPSRVVSKIGSEYQKPFGLTIVTPDNLAAFMENLPVIKIPGVGSVTNRILSEMGIKTAGQLAMVPEKYLESVFGLNGLKIAAYSKGLDGIPLRDPKAIRSVSRETGFADDITDQTVLLSHFFYLLERATRKLRTLAKKSASVKIKFRYADFKTVEGAIRIHPASNNENDIFPLIEMMFRRLFTRRVGLRLVGITLHNLKNSLDYDSLFNDRIEKNRKLLQSLDIARAKEGFFALTTGRTLSLSERYKKGDNGYELRTPSLSQ